MNKINFVDSKDKTQRGVLLADGRIISLYDENNAFYLRFNHLLDLEKGVFYPNTKIEATEENKAKGLTTLNDLIEEGKAKEIECYDYVDYDEDVYLDQVDGKEDKYIKKIIKFFKKKGYNVTEKAVRHNVECWLEDLKSGYRDEENGYHLFSPCGCNPLSVRLTTLHPLCEDWQQTYYA